MTTEQQIQKAKAQLAKERKMMGGPTGKGGDAVLSSADGPASLNIVKMLIDIIEEQAKVISTLKR